MALPLVVNPLGVNWPPFAIHPLHLNVCTHYHFLPFFTFLTQNFIFDFLSKSLDLVSLQVLIHFGYTWIHFGYIWIQFGYNKIYFGSTFGYIIHFVLTLDIDQSVNFSQNSLDVFCMIYNHRWVGSVDHGLLTHCSTGSTPEATSTGGD